MRTVFVGAVEGSRAALAAICKAGHAPNLVVTLPTDLARRHSDFADLGPIAAQYDIPVHRTEKSDAPDTHAAIAAIDPDIIMVIGWSQICGPAFRALARHGAIGFHPSALPQLRGRGVIPWTILMGGAQAGASLFWLDDGVDTGDIAAQRRFAIDPEAETARSLYDKVIDALQDMLPALLSDLKAGQRPAMAQDETQASVCARRRPSDGLIDWARPARDIHRLIRAAGPPYPGAFTTNAAGETLVITAAQICPRDGYYIGLPGQVQAVTSDHFTIYCGDGACLDVTAWSGAAPARHTHLGRSQP
ncbi:formyltransferase family protein [uncultured Tateyamaria sp.]|uniref:methionyl-tRNA formyltransferase n=1 Tax=uncultured Tateyamaria sp. TaxID=455651 RepID=UPI00262A27D4|nr:formyltransferase family protein [uncultured Tateyamaria sp.]